MKRALDVVGFALIAIMILGFVGALRPAVEPGASAVFWACAAGALGIILCKKMLVKKANSGGAEAQQ